MIHSAFKGIVVTFSSHFNAQTTAKRCVDMDIERDMLAGFAFKRIFEPRNLHVAQRLCGNNLGGNNAVFVIVTGYILCSAGGHFAKRAALAKQFHEVQQIRMYLTGKRTIQKRQTLVFCDRLISNQPHIIRVISEKIANCIQLSEQFFFKLLLFS